MKGMRLTYILHQFTRDVFSQKYALFYDPVVRMGRTILNVCRLHANVIVYC